MAIQTPDNYSYYPPSNPPREDTQYTYSYYDSLNNIWDVLDAGGFVTPGRDGRHVPPPPRPQDPPPFSFPATEFAIPEYPDYTELYRQQQEQAERAAGIRDRDILYREYLSAADDAVSYIDAMIGKEQAAANLMGVDYDISDEERSSRISNYFASIWSEGHQAQLEELMGTYGNPKGFNDFVIKRGDVGLSQDTTEAGRETIATSQGTKPLPMDALEEETIGGGNNTNLNLLNL